MESTLTEILLAIFSGAMTIIGSWLTYLFNKKEKQQQLETERRRVKEERQQLQNDAMMEGMQAILRDRILQLAAHCSEKGFVSGQQSKNMTLMYDAYHKLGGNGVVTTIYKQFQELHVKIEVNEV